MELAKIRVLPHNGDAEYDVCGFVIENTFEEVVLVVSEDPAYQWTTYEIDWKSIDKAETCDVVGELKRPEASDEA